MVDLVENGRIFYNSGMSVPILATKLYIPPARSDLVPRAHLLAQMNAGGQHKLTFLCAPAGFGKTTLVSAWLQQIDRPTAWLSLDESDNELARFLNYVIAALQQIAPEVGQTVRSLLQSPQLPSPEVLLTHLLNDLIKLPDFILVLDDFHLVDDFAVQNAVAYLLEHMPPTMHLVITSRADTNLPLSRLRGRHQLTEIRTDDLRFTHEEAATFLKQMANLTLSTEKLHVLAARTEGWVTGLQLAVLFMEGQETTHIAGFITSFTGNNRYVVDYLVAEVLNRQPQHVQDFLLQTSILDRMTSSLCNAVLGLANSQDILERLEQANLFIVPLDGERHWYRYHHFFTEFLQGRLQRHYPERVAVLHGRSADWYEAQNLPEQAIVHYLAAGKVGTAADLIETAVRATLKERGEVATVLNWLTVLPEDILLSRPQLGLAQAWGFLFAKGQWHLVEPCLQAIEVQLVAEVDASNLAELPPQELPRHIREMCGEIATIRAELALFQNDFLQVLTLTEQALAYLSADDVWLRSIVTQIQGYTYRLHGEVENARSALTESYALSQQVGQHVGIFALSDLAELHVMCGQLVQAANTYQRIMNLTREHHQLPLTGMAYIGMGDLLREWDDLDTAVQHLHKGVELISAIGYEGVVSRAYMTLAMISQATEKQEEALAYLQQAEDLAQKSGSQPMIMKLPIVKVRLWLRQGELAKAAQWADHYRWQQKQAPIILAYQHQFAEITLARVLLAQNELKFDLLAGLLQIAQEAGWQKNRIEILILQALMCRVQGDLKQALRILEEALTLATPEGYMRLFVDEGLPMAKLLQAASKQGIQPDYVGKLQASFKLRVDGGEMPVQALIDPLTRRELEVLALMAAGLSNREIADKLVVAPGTIAKYSNNIFTKLNVRNRIEAISRASALNLLRNNPF